MNLNKTNNHTISFLYKCYLFHKLMQILHVQENSGEKSKTMTNIKLDAFCYFQCSIEVSYLPNVHAKVWFSRKPNSIAVMFPSVLLSIIIKLFSVAFGMRKALQAEQGKADMEQKVRSQKHVQTCIWGLPSLLFVCKWHWKLGWAPRPCPHQHVHWITES